MILSAFALLGAGFLAGFLGGMIGAGGGLIVVPVLYHTFTGLGVDADHRMHMAVGTALAAVVPMSLLGARAQWKRGNVSLPIFKRLAAPVLFGSMLAGVVSGKVDPGQLSIAFALAATVVAASLLRKKAYALRDTLPGPVALGGIGASIGMLSTLVGIGGATLMVPMLNAFRTPIPLAIGTAATLGALIGLPGAIAFIASGAHIQGLPAGSVGYVNLLAVAIIFPASALAIPWGARLTQRVNERLLRALFAGFLAISATRMVLS